MRKAASAFPTINLSRSIQAIARNVHPDENNTMAENSNRACIAFHLTCQFSWFSTSVYHNDNEQGGDSSHTVSHSVDEVNVENIVAGVLDDASTLSSNTNGDNAESKIIFQQYFESLAPSGTIRNVVEEKSSSKASKFLFSK